MSPGQSIYTASHTPSLAQHSIRLMSRHTSGSLGSVILAVQGSLVPRPFKRRRRKGLVHIARACVGVSIATDRVTIVIVRGFCMT